MKFSRRSMIAAGVAIGAALLLPAMAFAAPNAVTIGYQTGVDPAKLAQAQGTYEKAIGAPISWRKFDTGSDVIAAIASGDLDIGYVGSSPLAAAATRQLPIETIFVAALLGPAEALVVRNGAGIDKPTDLVGKKIGVPFVSTGHYSLLGALKHWGIDPKSTQILNLRPPELAAAFARGDIDAGYVWEPALGKLKQTGKVLTDSAEVAKWGAPTFDAWIARKDFADKQPDAVTAFVKVTADAYKSYADNPAAWSATSEQAKAVAHLTGSKPEEVPELLRSNVWPTLAEEVSPELLGGGTVKAVTDTAAFLKEQGKVPAVLSDYGPYVNKSFALRALEKQAAN